MYVCVCNCITEDDLFHAPELKDEVGTRCGGCLEYIKRGVLTGTDTPLEVSTYEILDNRG